MGIFRKLTGKYCLTSVSLAQCIHCESKFRLDNISWIYIYFLSWWTTFLFIWKTDFHKNIFGPVTIKDMQTPLPLGSGHLDVKDAERAKKMMDVKFHILSCRVWAPCPKGAFWAPKNSTSFKSGQICRVDWNWPATYCSHKWFFVPFLVFEMWP